MEHDLNQKASISIWTDKPKWCQPWTILLTGIFLIALTFVWPKLIWFSILTSILVALWWILFLVIAPAAYARDNQDI